METEHTKTIGRLIGLLIATIALQTTLFCALLF